MSVVVRSVLAVVLAIPSAAACFAQHGGDIVLRVHEGAIQTGVEEAPGEFEPSRVFESSLGEIEPDHTDEPGFDSDPGTFTPGTRIGFVILDALRRWTGADFSEVPAERMAIESGVVGVETPAAPGMVQGFELAVGTNGQWHRHYEYTLRAPAGDGVYLLTLRLHSTDAGVGPSEPFWIVFGQNVTDGLLDEAVVWVRINLAGEALCDGIDFNGDGLFPDNQDLVDFLTVFGAGACSNDPNCGDIDFNNDGLFPDNEDILTFFRVFGGGAC